MPLADLLNQPKSAEDWNLWGFAHRDQHLLILGGIRKKYSVSLTEYPLYPINLSAQAQWLDWNQQAHDDFNGVLGTQSSDLQQVDLSNPRLLQAWIWLHYQEHLTAAIGLGVS